MRRKLKLHELSRPSVAEFQELVKHQIIVVGDNIRSAMNVGSFFRSCDAFAVQKLVLSGISAHPPHKEINKTAIGSTESVPWEYHDEVSSLIEKWKNEGYTIVAVEQTSDSISLNGMVMKKNEKYVVIFGNEVEGVSEEYLPLVDICVEIPQWGTKHSLNVSVCVGIVLWAFTRQLH